MSKERETSADDKDGDRKALGERLREAREYLGFSQDQVATFLGVSRSALSLMETGQRKVDALELKKLAGLYKRPVAFFTGEEAEDVSFGTDVKHLARQVSELSPDDREELGRFADFLRARKQKKGG
jgi:transcriptional regulator with XRE-family HTH domain